MGTGEKLAGGLFLIMIGCFIGGALLLINGFAVSGFIVFVIGAVILIMFRVGVV